MPYFDHNATTPLSLIAREAWLRASDEHWQNPSSPYRDAAKAKIRLDSARERIAEYLGAPAEQVVFTSGATEGAHAVLQHWARTFPAEARIAVNPTEHPCVLTAAQLCFPGRIDWLPVTRDGVVTADAVRGALASGTVAGAVVMAANNETGVLQPWAQIAELCRDRRVTYFCDASQWLGKLPASGLGSVDWVIGAGHKFGAPKGVGLVKIAAEATGFSVQPGGAQENGHRGGTENVPSIWALSAALAEAEQKKVFLEGERLRWRQAFERSLASVLPGATVIAAGADRLWNTVSLLVPSGENHRWVVRLDKLGFQVSTGSACATGKEGPSHVLAALGYSPAEAKRVLRISSGWETTEEDWCALGEALARVAPEAGRYAEGVVEIP